MILGYLRRLWRWIRYYPAPKWGNARLLFSSSRRGPRMTDEVRLAARASARRAYSSTRKEQQ